jgi:transmembrane sensor
VKGVLPIHSLLDVNVDPAATRRMWKEVARRRKRRSQLSHRRALLVAFFVGVASALCVIGVFGRQSLEHRPAVVEGPLRTPDGGPWTALDASVTPQGVELDDGSKIGLERGRLTTLENNERSVVILMSEGRASFDVRPGGRRRWSIEAGLATIEVVGTRFTVTREPSQVLVEVDRGAVLVRGENVADRVQRLVAGERLVVEPSHVPPVPASSISAPSSSGEPRPQRIIPPQGQVDWSELAHRGDYSEAYDELGTRGIAAQSATADLEKLLMLADVARLSGHPADAIDPLRRIIAEHSADSRAAVASFTLGRIHLDSLKAPAAAASDFRAAIALKLPSALVEDAYLRWIEASAKAGDRKQTHEAFDRYRTLFPQSNRMGIADKWAREL